MNVIRNRTVVPDRWRHELSSLQELATADIAPGDVIVSLDRWIADWEALLARGSQVGVRIAAGDDLETLIHCELHELWLVEIEFSTFAEGRGYSQARLLRTRHEFHGDLRATGDVTRDRIAFMERCGFNCFVLREVGSLEGALEAFDEIEGVYQPGADRGDILARLRGYRRPRLVRSAA